MGAIWLFSKRLITFPVNTIIADDTVEGSGVTVMSGQESKTILDWIQYIASESSNVIDIKIDNNKEYATLTNTTSGTNTYTIHSDIANAIGINTSFTLDVGDIYTGYKWGNKRFLFSGWDIGVPIETWGNRIHPVGSKGIVTVDGRTIRQRLLNHAKLWRFTTEMLTPDQTDDVIDFFDDLGSNTDCEFYPEAPDIFNGNKQNYQVTVDKELALKENAILKTSQEWILSDRN